MNPFVALLAVLAWLGAFLLGLAYLTIALPLHILFWIITRLCVALVMLVAFIVSGIHYITRSAVRRTN